MKKLLFCIALILAGCCNNSKPLPPDPHWKYQEHVKFEVPEFYRLVCDGNGIVLVKATQNDTVIYTVEPSYTKGKSAYDCINAQNTFDIYFKRDNNND